MADAHFQSLVDRWYDPLYRFALSLCRNRDGALDLTQQTFARWAEKGSGLRDATKAKSWLFTVLYREFLSSQRQQRREAPPDAENFFESVPAAEVDSPRQVDGRQALRALQDLDPVFRAPLVLFYLESHSYKEIADVLDIPIGTVMSRIARGKEQLRRKLHDTADEQPTNLIPLTSPVKKAHHG